MGFWMWLLLSGKKAALSRMGKVWIASNIPLWTWILLTDLKLSLLGILVWAIFWCLFGAHEYYSEYIKKETT